MYGYSALGDFFFFGYSGKLSPSTAEEVFKIFYFCKALPEEDDFICPATSSASSELMTANRLVIILLIKQFLGKGFPGLSLSKSVGA